MKKRDTNELSISSIALHPGLLTHDLVPRLSLRMRLTDPNMLVLQSDKYWSQEGVLKSDKYWSQEV